MPQPRAAPRELENEWSLAFVVTRNVSAMPKKLAVSERVHN